MRTVLALDQLLARSVAAKLRGEVVTCTRQRMRDEGDDAVQRIVMAAPSALIIGAQNWNPLDLLEAWQLPYEIPVIMVVPSMNWADEVRAARLDVFSIFVADKGYRGLPTSLASESVIAHAWMKGGPFRHARPVVVQPSPRPQVEMPGRLLRFAR